MKKVLSEIAYRIKRNPVLLGTALLWAFETAGSGDPLTWHGGLLLAVGVLVRSKVVPADEAKVVSDFLSSIVESIVDGEHDA